MPSASRKHLATALIFIVPALWSVNYLIARRALGVIAPNLLAGERWLMAGAAFCVIYRHELWAQRRVVLADWRRMLVLGALGMWICGAWVYLGGQTTSATNIALIYSLSPVMIVVVSRLWLKESFSLLQGCGVALALAGVVHVVLKGEWTELAKVQWVIGDAWILAATLSWTFLSIPPARFECRGPAGIQNATASFALSCLLGTLYSALVAHKPL